MITRANSFIHLLIIMFFLISCNNKKENEPEIKQLNIGNSEKFIDSGAKDVTLIGKTDDPYAFKYLNLLDFSKFGFSQYESPNTKELIADSLRLILHKIDRPQLMDLVAFSQNRDTVPYYTRIFVTPGDSIHLNVKNGQLNFEGKNQPHYNFFLKMGDPLRQKWAVYKNNPYTYKAELKKAYEDKSSILEDYVQEHPEVTDSFRNLVGSELKFEYLYHLILPRNVKDKKIEGNYQNNEQGILMINTIANPNSETFLDVSKYFEGITISDFQRPELINNDYFKRSLVLYIRHYFANHEYLEYSRTNFLNEKKFIQVNLDGKLESYAIGRLINDYFQKGFGQGEQDVELLKDLIHEYQENFSETSYASRMNEILRDLQRFNFRLPPDVMAQQFLTPSLDTITFAQILRKSGNRIKVLDFWGSYCPPCIIEFKKSQSFRENLVEKREIHFLYLSLDENRQKWLDGLEKWKPLIGNDNNYLILDRENASLLDYMMVVEESGQSYFIIPRYSILSFKNRIISNNAPKPSDSLKFLNIINMSAD